MNVEIKAIANLESESAQSGLTAQLFREADNAKIQFLSSFVVPIQARGNVPGKKVDIEAGKYLLQILLPDGQTLTKDFEVEPIGQQEIVIDLPHEGPHEWTTLHAMAGNFRREAQLTEGFTKQLSLDPKGNYRSLVENLDEGFELSLLKSNKEISGESFSGNYIIEELGKTSKANLPIERVVEAIGEIIKIDEPTREDSDFAMFKVTYGGVLSAWVTPAVTHRFDRNQNFARCYLLQKSSLGMTLIALPTPWIKSYGQGEAEIEFLVKKNAAGEPPEFLMTINEPMINTVLGYINIGAFNQAAQLINTNRAVSMLFEKMENPFAAVVGAYLLMQGNERESKIQVSNRWKDWINNLDKWFDWLPDGAVLNAAKHFWRREYLQEKDIDFTESYSKSLEALNRSYDRGLPFFTFGLKLMIDGFRYFANEGNRKAKRRLDALEVIANQTDPSQPFLTINFSQRQENKLDKNNQRRLF